MIWGGADVIIEIKCTINVISLNHPKTIPTLVCRKIVFYETHPWGCWKSQVLPPIFQEKGFHKGVNVSRENLGAIWESVHHTSFGSSLSSRRMASPCFCLSCYSPMHLTSKQNFHYSPRCQGFWRTTSLTRWKVELWLRESVQNTNTSGLWYWASALVGNFTNAMTKHALNICCGSVSVTKWSRAWACSQTAWMWILFLS